MNDVLESSDEPFSLPSQQQQSGGPPDHLEVLTNDVEQDIEDENPPTVFNSDVKLKLKEESVIEEGNSIRRRK